MPEPIRQLTGIAAPLPLDNVDTDMIWPAGGGNLRRGQQAAQALRHMRFRADGSVIEDFVLNREPWRQARILIAGDNFGCGSSREMAVWSLYDLGLRCVIAPRFGDIFYNNCCINGLLPVRLPGDAVSWLMDRVADPETAELTIDLEACLVIAGNRQFAFAIEQRNRQGLLEGLNQLDRALGSLDVIRRFALDYAERHPWTQIDTALLGNEASTTH